MFTGVFLTFYRSIIIPTTVVKVLKKCMLNSDFLTVFEPFQSNKFFLAAFVELCF